MNTELEMQNVSKCKKNHFSIFFFPPRFFQKNRGKKKKINPGKGLRKTKDPLHERRGLSITNCERMTQKVSSSNVVCCEFFFLLFYFRKGKRGNKKLSFVNFSSHQSQ